MAKQHLQHLAAVSVVSFIFSVTPATTARAAGVDTGVIGTTLGGVGTTLGGVAGTVSGSLGAATSATLGGAGSGIGGALGGIAPGSLGGITPGSLSGPAGTITSAAGASAFSSFLSNSASPNGTSSTGSSSSSSLGAALSWSLRAALQLMAKQRIIGKLQSISDSRAQVQTADGTMKSFVASADLVAVLCAFLGKTVMLRSADGVHLLAVVGRDDTVRGTVTAVDRNTVGFISPYGEAFVMTLGQGSAAVRVGSRVIAQSHDFGRSAALAVFRVSAPSSLSDVFVGQLADASQGRLRLRFGSMLQTFAADGATLRTAAKLKGKTIAIAVPDGIHVKSLLAAVTVSQLMQARAGSNAGGVRAVVLGASRNFVIVQLPNGDVQSYAGTLSSLSLRDRTAVTITPLDRYHARIRVGEHFADPVNADLCITLNASCHTSMNGQVTALTASSLVVRFASGDVSTFLGNILDAGVTAGLPVIVTPLDRIHTRVVVAGKILNLVDAGACATINSGCNAMPGSVIANGNGSLIVGLADGSTLTLAGTLGGPDVLAGTPIIIQPLDATHALAQVGGTVGNLVDARACAFVNALCPPSGATATTGGLIRGTASSGATLGGSSAGGNSGIGLGSASGGSTAGGGASGTGSNGSGAAVGSSAGGTGLGGGNAGSGNANGGSAGGGNAGGGGRGIGSNPALDEVALAPRSRVGEEPLLQSLSGVLGSAFGASTPCNSDGQVVVQVTDTSGAPLAHALVRLDGPTPTAYVSGDDGIVAFFHLVAGDYSAVALRDGYDPIRSPSFSVDCAAAKSVGFVLAPKAIKRRQPIQLRSAVTIRPARRLTLDATRALATRHANICISRGKVRPSTICAKHPPGTS